MVRPHHGTSIQVWVSYTEYSGRRDTLSKDNQTVTSDWGKHPDPSHQDRDPTCVTSTLWPDPDKLSEHWVSDEGTGSLTRGFSIVRIHQYFFRTRSPVTMFDTEVGMWVMSSPHYSSMTILIFVVTRKSLILPYLTVSFHPRSGVAASTVSM